jgi:hypothetical protein
MHDLRALDDGNVLLLLYLKACTHFPHFLLEIIAILRKLMNAVLNYYYILPSRVDSIIVLDISFLILLFEVC